MNKWERKIRFQQNKSKYIKRGTIALSVVLLIVGVIYITYSKFESTQEYTLINGKITSNGDASIVAIYQGDTKVDSIPQKGGLWTFDRAECTNATGSWNIDDWGLYINNIIGKVKCNLYFKPNMVSYINTLGTTDTTNLIADGTSDNNLRYVGSNPNNYVSFNGELWRIIGVMNNIETAGGTTESLVKLIRKDSLGQYSWDTSDSSINSGVGTNQWGESGTYEGADLMRELNTDYLGNITVGTDGKWYSGVSNEKNATMPSTTLSDASQSMIESVVWSLGSPGNDNGVESSWNNSTPITVYVRERVQTTSWTGKVVLMYPSDYGYATSGGSSIDREACLNISMQGADGWANSTNYDCKNNDWLYKSNNQWTISPRFSANGAFYISSSGNIDDMHGHNSYGVTPAVFLKSGVAITGGEGTEANPYTLG